MSREDIQTNVRLPADIKAALLDQAKYNRRSLSAEIVDRLNASFAPREVLNTLSDALVGETPSSGWGGLRSAEKKKDDAFYATLVKVADTLSSDTRSEKQERDLLADVVRLMAKIRTGYYK